MHSAAEELSTGPRLTTVMKPIPVGGEGGSERGGGGGNVAVRGGGGWRVGWRGVEK